jgi:hypothetical protein
VKPPGRKTKIDPEIVKLRKKHAEEVKEYKRARASAALLKTILNKRLPNLIQTDREKLLDVLMVNTTRCFPAMLKQPEDQPEPVAQTPNEAA